MTMTKRYALVGLLVGSAAAGTAESAAASDINCQGLSNPVYVSGGSAAEPHLLALASVLGTSVSIIYATPTACIGLQDVTTPGQTEGTKIVYLDPATTPPSAKTCQTSTATAYPPFYADVGVSGAYPSSCISPQISLGTTYQDFQGPIEAFEVAVPWGSNQSSISADAAYVVFGWGGEGQYAVTPWTVPANVYTRGQTSAVQLVIADSIGLLGSKWLTNTGDAGLAQVIGSESTMVTTLQSATNYNATIGILGSGALNPVKFAPTTSDAGVTTGGLKPLAYQDTNQTPPQDCGYYADSDVAHFDKINVRQGRYGIWGPEHFVAAVDANGNPVANPQGVTNNTPPSSNAAVQLFLSHITHAGTGSTLPFPTATALTATELQSTIQAEITSHFIPECAMEVSRAEEDGAEASYQPAKGCGCYFESISGGGTTLSTYCAKCTTSSDCTVAGYPVCNFGYCEAQ